MCEHNISFNTQKFHIVRTPCVCVFRMDTDITTIISLHKHQLTGFYDPGGMFTEWYEIDP